MAAAAPKPFSLGTTFTSTPGAASTSAAPALGGFNFAQPPAPSSAPPSFGFSASAPPAASAPGATFSFAQSTSQQQHPFSFSAAPATTAQAPATAPGLFNPLGSSAPPAAQANSSAPSTSLAASNKTSRFEDLPEAERKALLDLEQFIHSRTAIADELKSKTLGDDIKRSHDVLQDIGTGLASLQTSLTSITHSTRDLRSRNDVDGADRIKAQRIVDAYSASKQGGPAATAAVSSARSLANFPYDYFLRQIGTLTARLQAYHEALNQVQGQLRQQEANQARAILPSLKAQHALCISLAARLSTLHQDMDELRAVYTRMWRDRVGSVRNPFEDGRLTATRETSTSMSGLSI